MHHSQKLFTARAGVYPQITAQVPTSRALRHHARLEKAGGYFYFWTEDTADWVDRTVRVETPARSRWSSGWRSMGLKKVNAELVRQARVAEKATGKRKRS